MDSRNEAGAEVELHEATIDLKLGADQLAERCIDACDEVDGEAELEAVIGLAWNILVMDGDHDKDNHREWERSIDEQLGFALRVGVAIGQRLK
jgi:hypothetical protein